MLTVACVLRSGGEYQPEHVKHLRSNVKKYLAFPHRFVCVTDTPIEDVHCILLRHNWPGWWSKMELWRPGLFGGTVLYFDLDTVLVSSIDNMIGGHRFTVLRNMWATKESHDRIGSGVMAWAGDLSALYETFAADPLKWMGTTQTPDNWGDQGFIQRHSPVEMERWQDRHPGRVVSWRKDCKRGVPQGASIVVFGGPARPWKSPLWGKHG